MSAEKPKLDRSTITFSQAEGLEPLPQPLQLREISQQFRSLLWKFIYEGLESNRTHTGVAGRYIVDGVWAKVLYDWHVLKLHRPADDFNPRFAERVEDLKHLILKGAYNEIFDFCQFVMRHRACPYSFRATVAYVLESSRAAYRVIDDGRTIVPSATIEEGEAIQRALSTLSAHGLDGARTHLLKAVEAIDDGDFADSIRESIHAVESVARNLDPKASKTLGPALKALEQKISIHKALKTGFSNIYGYTNDEQGIRHSLTEGDASVDLEDAVFMLGACASFVTYLVGKARKAGLLEGA